MDEQDHDTPLAPPRVRRSPAEMAALKREMLELARRIYRDEGLDALSMRRLGQELGISTMAIYSYFPSKQALLDGLWIDIFEALVERLLAASEGLRGPEQVLESHLVSFMAFWEEHPEQFRMIYMSAAQSATQEAVGEAQQPVYHRLLRLVRERVAACLRAAPGQESAAAEAELRLHCDLLSAKTMGYLILAVGLQRYPLRDRAALKARLVQEVLRDVAAPGR